MNPPILPAYASNKSALIKPARTSATFNLSVVIDFDAILFTVTEPSTNNSPLILVRVVSISTPSGFNISVLLLIIPIRLLPSICFDPNVIPVLVTEISD